jgi:hypothetical protein
MNEEGEFLHLLFFLSHLYVATNSSRSRLNLAPIFQETRKGLAANKKEKAPTRQAGKFVREEIKHTFGAINTVHCRRKKRCNRLSMARRAGTKLPRPFAERVQVQNKLNQGRKKKTFSSFLWLKSYVEVFFFGLSLPNFRCNHKMANTLMAASAPKSVKLATPGF